jgi:hypothetical protein
VHPPARPRRSRKAPHSAEPTCKSKAADGGTSRSTHARGRCEPRASFICPAVDPRKPSRPAAVLPRLWAGHDCKSRCLPKPLSTRGRMVAATFENVPTTSPRLLPIRCSRGCKRRGRRGGFISLQAPRGLQDHELDPAQAAPGKSAQKGGLKRLHIGRIDRKALIQIGHCDYVAGTDAVPMIACRSVPIVRSLFTPPKRAPFKPTRRRVPCTR